MQTDKPSCVTVRPRQTRPAPEFPGWRPVRIRCDEIASYEGRFEFWDADTETAWMVRDPTSATHEHPSQRLAGLGRLIRFRASRLRAAIAATGAAAAISALALSPAADAGTSGPAIAPPASTGGAPPRAAGAVAGIASATVPAERTTASAASAGRAPPAASPRGDFYLRAGISLDWSKETRFQEKDCSAPIQLYGCGPGSDGAPLSSLGDFGTMSGVEVGVGYVASPLLRLEGTIQYRPSISFSGRANFLQDKKVNRTRTVRADLSSLSAMLAIYLDLTELGLRRLGPFSPFVGGGMGLSRIDINESRMEFPDSKTTTVVRGWRRVNFAWMLMAGVATPLGENSVLDLAWRYTDSGAVETGRGGGVVCRIEMCSFGDFLKLDFGETRADLASHGLQVSVRYAF